MNNNLPTAASFKKGDRVRYNGETGKVTSCNANYVFVDYQGTGRGVATDPKDLQKVKNKHTMNLGIKVKQLEESSVFLAEVDWSKGDAGQVGTPGAIKYGHSEIEACQRLKELLESKGHTVIE